MFKLTKNYILGKEKGVFFNLMAATCLQNGSTASGSPCAAFSLLLTAVHKHLGAEESMCWTL